MRWQDDPSWQPTPGDVYECACGCGELLQYKGIGRPQKYVSETHRIRHYRARKKAESIEFP